jgi:hypothetical protein
VGHGKIVTLVDKDTIVGTEADREGILRILVVAAEGMETVHC